METDDLQMPDQEQDSDQSGLTCLFSIDRLCGADCMAWTTQPAEKSALNEQQKHCTIIVSLERLGRYAGFAVKMFKDSARHMPAPPIFPLSK